MINEKDKTKLDRWTEMETRINNIFWHLRVSEENETHPCRLVLLNELNAIKRNYDYIDNY
jgi:hypothetical protein